MIYSHEVETMCPIAQGVAHGAAPIPEEAKWVKAKEIKDISGFTHGIGWCAPQHSTAFSHQLCASPTPSSSGRGPPPANNSGTPLMEVKSTAYGNLGTKAFLSSLVAVSS